MTDPLEDATAPHEMDEKPIPMWQKLSALGVLVAVIAIVVLFHGRFSADFYPVDASRVAPNIVASLIQWAIVFLAAILIWPPTRRRLHRFADAKLAPVHAHLQHLRKHHEASRILQEHIVKQNAHIIASSKTIKNVHPDGTDLTELPEIP